MEAGRLSEITALFADCRGFTALTHKHGVEAVRPIIDQFFGQSTEIVVSQDGIIDHFLGDAVLAFFNVPIRREDHAARAVTVASQIQQASLGIPVELGDERSLKVGIGVASGMAYTGTVGSKSCASYTALGDVVNIAARLQGEAAPGEILLTEEVYQKVRSAFPNARQRELQLKGVPEPVRAYLIATAGPIGP